MRIIALIDDRTVIKRILRHLGLWEQGIRIQSGTDPPVASVLPPVGGQKTSLPTEHRADDPFPDYDTEPVMMVANG